MTLRTIAVVGVGAQPGSRARQYLATIARLSDHYRLVAVCDPSAEARQEVALRYGVAATYADVGQLFRDQHPEVVLSMAPKDAHVVVALTAARHGAHIITEIPVALTRRYAQAIARTCREHGVLWEVAEQCWLWPQERLKRRLIAAGHLGTVVHARLCYQSGPYHGFSALRALLGTEARRVLGYVGVVPSEPYVAYGGEPEISLQWESATIEFANGVVCLFEKPPRIFPQRSYTQGWQLEGTRGYLDGNRFIQFNPEGFTVLPLEEEYIEQDAERVLAAVRVATDPPVVWENPFRQYGIGSPDDVAKASILTGFHAAIARGGPAAYGLENGLRDWELCLAVRESACRGNSWVALPLANEPTDLERQIETEYVRRYGHDPVVNPEALLATPFTRSTTLWTAAQWL